MNAEIQIAVEQLSKHVPQLIAIILFGSFGTEYETDQSDLDLAILSSSKLEVVAMWELSQKIAIQLNKDVDLVDLRQASTVFKFQILSTGKIIFCTNLDEFALFETTAFSMYLSFQETRKEILQDYGG